MKTLEIRSNHLEDKFDLENESCLKTMEIRSKVQNFPLTSNPTTFELKWGPMFGGGVGLGVGRKNWTFDLISIVLKVNSISRSNLSSR